MATSVARVLTVVLVSVMLTPHVHAEAAVELDEGVKLAPIDLGIEGVAIDPLGEKVIVYGAESYLNLLDASDPTIRTD